MVRELKGNHNGNGLHIAVVVACFNETVTSKLLQGALDGLSSHGVLEQDITVAWAPGSFELPVIAQNLIDTGEFDAVICLGAVIRHETDHHLYVAREATHGIASVSRETGVPTIFGILTTDSEEQAMARAGGKEGNRGYDAALAAIEMATLMREISGLG